ncbi:NAD-dependent protein deacetylase hst2-1 [Phlyctema vagabunda]|uniref:NAD-dependent protein deacetylase hst2-1 n=1 Tax=Phlyctema vagabunda TaxID=108571 RepID=A0ABR4P9J6_9HELO
MGQEGSQMVDESVRPEKLDGRNLSAIAKFIAGGHAKKIVVMTGAGISTSAGIPDFRSPETGLYSNLARLDLDDPEDVFDIHFFRKNPNPFYVLAKELYPGKFSPTVSHAFIALLERKGLLEMLFTQNIDCLERRAGVSAERIVEAHGSFATQRCIDCKTEYPEDLMLKAVEAGEVPHCPVPQCNGLVKPDIVFFGEGLPSVFFSNIDVPTRADLVIVMGTSLSVAPFSQLPGRAAEGVPRLLFNLERVGDLGSRRDDVVVLGDCDAGVRKLADELGWREELEGLWREVSGKEKEEALLARLEAERATKSKDELLADEIVKLTSEVDETLQLSSDHQDWVNKGLDKDPRRMQPGAGAAALDAIAITPGHAESRAPASEPLSDDAEDSWRRVDGQGDELDSEPTRGSSSSSTTARPAVLDQVIRETIQKPSNSSSAEAVAAPSQEEKTTTTSPKSHI